MYPNQFMNYGQPTLYPTYGRAYMNNMNNMNGMNYPMNQQPMNYMQQAPGFANSMMNSTNQMAGSAPMGTGSPQVYCKQVTSEQEAAAAMIDLDGSLYIFTDIPHRKIYTKQLGLDGLAPLQTYELVDNSQPVVTGQVVEATATPVPSAEENYATKEDVGTLLKFYDDMEAQLAGLRDDIESLINSKTDKKSSVILEG